MLQNEYLDAKIGFDTAENEPQKEPSTRLFFAAPNRAKYSVNKTGHWLVCSPAALARERNKRRAPKQERTQRTRERGSEEGANPLRYIILCTTRVREYAYTTLAGVLHDAKIRSTV